MLWIEFVTAKGQVVPGINEDIPLSEDAIPKDAISLTDAFGYIVSFIGDHPELLPTFDQQWSEALQKSREEERRIQHAPIFDQELEQEWHRRKEANLFLRLAIEERELVACTRDPHTGRVTTWTSLPSPVVMVWVCSLVPSDVL